MTFTQVGQKVYEFDGRQELPGIVANVDVTFDNHFNTLQDASLDFNSLVIDHIQKYIELDPEEKQYAVLALAKTPE